MTFLRCLTLGFALLLLVVGHATAQPTSPVDTFDLVLYGNDLAPSSQQVDLNTNPWRGNSWTAVAPSPSSAPCTSQPQLRVVPGLSTGRYLGQDVREHYVALKISTSQDEPDGRLRAAYALPSADTLNPRTCERLATLIETDPSAVRRHSLAAYARPRPASLSAEAPFIEHLEAPIRHRKPGVMEVEWLEILFAPEE